MNNSLQEITQEVRDILAESQIAATPQAELAVVHAIFGLHGVAGDTDSLLYGLLMSGSYAVDAIELAGVNPHALRDQALASLQSAPHVEGMSRSDCMDAFFNSGSTASGALLRFASEKRVLECADILRFAIAPVSIEHATWETRKSDRRSIIDDTLQSVIIDRLIEHYHHLSDSQFPERDFQKRRTPLAKAEQEKLVAQFDHSPEAGSYALTAMNEWFVHRRVATPTVEELACLASNTGNYDVGFGPELFMDNGGDYHALETNLTLVNRFNPERDASALVVALRDGKVCAGEYTYRNSLCVETPGAADSPFQRMSFQALRPLPLVSSHVITLFEDLLSSDHLTESKIQRFLNEHSELLLSCGGYTGAFPHLSLTEEKKSDMIPDYLLELPGDRGFDIVDLKLPAVKVTAGDRYRRMSSELLKAVTQLRNYQKYFDNSDNRKSFLKRYGLDAFRPEVVVVIGRSSEFRSRDDRKVIEEQLDGARLLTYDDLITYGRSRSISVPQGLWRG